MHGELIVVDRKAGSAEALKRIPLGAPVSRGGLAEASLQELLFRFPEALPVSAIDAAYAGHVPVCRELSTPAGYIDALYVNPVGRLTLAEFKLWRNPQARREVIGQVLDYAKELARWGYEDLQREVSRALDRKGNVLFELIRECDPEAVESEFVDNVTRHLKRGEFLLLIIGDGIREGVENIVDFVQRHSGLRFNLALVEAALYRGLDNRLIVQPRILARTEVVRRFVAETDVAGEEVDEGDEVPPAYQEENVRFWEAVLDGYSFSDVAIEVPAPSKESAVYVRVDDSGWGGWGLSFSAFLHRSASTIGCFLTRRSTIPAAVRVYGMIDGSFDDFREELGADLERWTSAGRPRIGFRRRVDFPLAESDASSDDFEAAVSWMREKLEVLVGGLHPRLRSMIADDS